MSSPRRSFQAHLTAAATILRLRLFSCGGNTETQHSKAFEPELQSPMRDLSKQLISPPTNTRHLRCSIRLLAVGGMRTRGVFGVKCKKGVRSKLWASRQRKVQI